MVNKLAGQKEFNSIEELIGYFQSNLDVYVKFSDKEKELVIGWYKECLSPICGYSSYRYNPKLFRQIVIYIIKNIYAEA